MGPIGVALLRIPLTDDRDIDRSRQWFARHGSAAVLTGRFVPLVRSLVSLPAGTQGMGRVRFGLLTAVGSGVWNVLWLGVGRIVGQRWRDAGRYSDWMNWVLVVALVVVVGQYVWTRRHRIPPLSRDEA